MSRKTVSTIVLFFLMICTLTLASKIQSVKADAGTIFIEPDGSIYPVGSPISSLDNVTYSLMSNVSSPIVILKNNMVFDGSGCSTVGSGGGYGINVTQRANVTITGVEVTGFDYGIWLYDSSNCSVAGNNLTGNNWVGITLCYSDNNVVSRNKATNDTEDSGIWVFSSAFNTVSLNEVSHNHDEGLYVDTDSHDNLFSENNITDNNGLPWTYGIYAGPYSDNNTFVENNITNNPVGIYIHQLSSNNTIFHNNFIGNTLHAYIEGNTPNTWDNGKEGNYWDNYTGPDSNHDGIGDAPYIIDANNTDYYPLMGTFQSFNVTNPSSQSIEFEEVEIISNTTIGSVDCNIFDDDVNSPTRMDWFLTLAEIVGQNETIGFCRITFPNDLMNYPTYHVATWEQYFANVTTDGSNCTILNSNSENTTLYFTFNLSDLSRTLNYPDFNLIILPEFPSFLILSLFMMATLLALIISKKKT